MILTQHRLKMKPLMFLIMNTPIHSMKLECIVSTIKNLFAHPHVSPCLDVFVFDAVHETQKRFKMAQTGLKPSLSIFVFRCRVGFRFSTRNNNRAKCRWNACWSGAYLHHASQPRRTCLWMVSRRHCFGWSGSNHLDTWWLAGWPYQPDLSSYKCGRIREEEH